MEPIESIIYHHPEWVQPKTFQNRFELRDGEFLFASLEFPKIFGSLAVAETSLGKWTFKRVGFFQTRITVREDGKVDDLGVYTPRWTGSEGKLVLTSGSTYTWKVANFWATQFVWDNAQGQPIIIHRPGVEAANMTDWFKMQARLEFQTEAITNDFRKSSEFALLVVLGWYLMVLKSQDDTAATVVIAT